MRKNIALLFFFLLSACQPMPIERVTPNIPPANNLVELQEISLDIGYGVDGGILTVRMNPFKIYLFEYPLSTIFDDEFTAKLIFYHSFF